MPTYQYACTACAGRLEVVQKFTDDPLTECPECGGALRKVFSAVGVVFKGSGFYKTDSRSSAKPASSSASPSASSSDSKPEASSSSSSADGASSAAPKPSSSTGSEAAAS